ncbi:MAG: alpha-L-arabinofuranosidase C-terminal domain-containing protein [Promethearchaeota archaeon]
MEALIRVDATPERRVPASRLVLGHFIEHLGRCIENGLWMYKDSPRPLLGKAPLERVPLDLFQAVKALRPPVVRWPGGCFADTYHWEDGVGPRGERPTRKNRAWGGIKSFHVRAGPRERNHFGTDEFVAFCRRLGAEPYINVNFGTGTPREAADWVEYCNGPAESGRGAERAANGHPEPYGVKFWGIGNEVFGWWEKGHCKTGDEYGRKYLKFAQAMRAVDPSIKLLAVGSHDSNWNRSLLGVAKGYADFLTVHEYLPTIGLLGNIFGRKPLPETSEVYYSILNSAALVGNLVERAAADIRATVPGGTERCKVAVDEWGIWYHYSQVYRADKPHFVLRDALWGACVLNGFIRRSGVVGMANYAQLVNCIGIILTYQSGVVKTPHYLVFRAFGEAWPGEDASSVPLEVEAPPIASRPFGKTIPALEGALVDASALVSNDGRTLTVYCVNKSYSEHARVELDLGEFEGAGQVKALLVSHDSPFATNTREDPGNLNLRELEPKNRAPVLPPHSFGAWQWRK